jgi:hypothetical protein
MCEEQSNNRCQTLNTRFYLVDCCTDKMDRYHDRGNFKQTVALSNLIVSSLP